MYNHQELVSCQFDDLLKWREVYQEIYFTFEFDESRQVYCNMLQK